VKGEEWESYEVTIDPLELLAEVVLTQEPGTYVVINDSDTPYGPRPYVALIVPEWGEA